MNHYVWLVAASAIATFILIVVGGVVRITGSGLGCPDWPLCHGQVVPPFRVDALIEFSHRFIAATMTIISGVALVFAWFPRRRPAAPWLTAAALTLVVQIGVGAAVVLLETLPLAVNVHLIFAMTIFALILVAL
ncbi:MAG: COX15/CtaA family protein, partial [Dehalococcoidia bacterium]|nr:COX15/CtaA family protein [Dehalococcoidia bacterium]